MKRSIAKVLLACLIVSSASAPLQAMGWGQWFKNGLSSMQSSIYNSSTETKVLVGLGALATAGIAYLLYRYLNPTDEELCMTAEYHIRAGQSYVNVMPTIDPLDENQLNTIGWQLRGSEPSQPNWSPNSLSQGMSESIRSLKAQRDILTRRIEKYQKANQYVSLQLDDNLKTIVALIPQLQARIAILNTHGHYFRMVILQGSVNWCSKAIVARNNMGALVPIIRNLASTTDYPFLTFVKWLNRDIKNIEHELKVVPPLGDYADIYTRKRGDLRNLKSGLETARDTILSSTEYKEDQTRKDAYDAQQRELELKREANRIAAQKAADERWAREEKSRNERKRLELEIEKNQRERENHTRK